MVNLYRYIEDGTIIGGPQALPTNWRDKGDISAWSDDQLAVEGWLPNVVVDARVAGEVDAGWTDELQSNRVIQTLHSQPAPTPSPEEIEAAVVAGVQQRLDAFAQSRGYDDVLSACTYANSTIDKFKAEGQRCVDLRDQCWATCYQFLASALQNGSLPNVDDVMAALPAMEWPA